MKAWIAFAPLLVTCAISASCSASSSPRDTAPSLDGSTPPSPSPDADVNDDADAGPSDAGGLRPREVDCADPTTCYVAVSGNGGRHTCGLLKDGTVQCWGRDTGVAPLMTDGGAPRGDRALGRGADVSRLEGATPAKVAGLSNVTQLSVGANFGTCARTSDGAVYCWGRNDFGQLGRPFPKRLTDTEERDEARLTMPTRIEGLPPVDEVALGGRFGCAIASSDRAVYCWGTLEPRERFGVPSISTDWLVVQMFGPQRVPTFRAPAKALRIGTTYGSGDTVVVLLEGDVLASIGNRPLTGDSTYPTTGPSERLGVLRIGTFAYVAGDDLVRRGLPTEERLYLPTRAPVLDITISCDHECSNNGVDGWRGGALTATGRLFLWGANPGGALAKHPNELPGARYPVEIQQLREQVVSFASTAESTCASLVDGNVKCWGANGYGELGRGAFDLDPHPEPEVIR